MKNVIISPAKPNIMSHKILNIPHAPKTGINITDSVIFRGDYFKIFVIAPPNSKYTQATNGKPLSEM